MVLIIPSTECFALIQEHEPRNTHVRIVSYHSNTIRYDEEKQKGTHLTDEFDVLRRQRLVAEIPERQPYELVVEGPVKVLHLVC